MKKKPTCKSCALFKEKACEGLAKVPCEQYKYRGNRHKGDKGFQKTAKIDHCVDTSCRFWTDKDSDQHPDFCKKNANAKKIEGECKFWTMRLAAQLDMSEKETDKLIAKAKENRIPGNQIKVGKYEKHNHNGETPAATMKGPDMPTKPIKLKEYHVGIRAIDLLEVFHAAKTSSAIETIIDLCKNNDIEIVIRPARKQ